MDRGLGPGVSGGREKGGGHSSQEWRRRAVVTGTDLNVLKRLSSKSSRVSSYVKET